ncbi:hypothetical protein HK102_004126, partial [Quaeritorhiza haematococci]
NGGTIKLDYGYVMRESEAPSSNALTTTNTGEAPSNALPSTNGEGTIVASSSTATTEESSTSTTNTDVFHTRQLMFPLMLTVHQGLQATNIDILLFSGTSPDSDFDSDDVKKSQHQRHQQQQEQRHIDADALTKSGRNLSLEELMVDPFGQEGHEVVKRIPHERVRDYCLFTFDLKNLWSHPFEVSFEIYDDEDQLAPSSVSTTIVHAGCTKRVILPIQRINLPETLVNLAIPTSDWRQHVVGKVRKFTSKVEQRTRQAMFWYKEALVGGLKQPGLLVAKWNCSSDRAGQLNLRNLRLNNPMLNVLKMEQVSYSVRMIELPEETDSPTSTTAAKPATNNMIRTKGLSHFECPVRRFVAIEWTIVNRTANPLKLCMRIQPVQDLNNGTAETGWVNMDVNMEDRIMWGGCLENTLPELAGYTSSSKGENTGALASSNAKSTTTTYLLPVVFLADGTYKFLYHTEDVMGNVERGGGNDLFWGAEPVVVEAVGERGLGGGV